MPDDQVEPEVPLHQNITGHLRYTARLLDREIEGRRAGATGPGDIDGLECIERIVQAEFVRQQKAEAYEGVRHPLSDLIVGWPRQHRLTVAIQAIVDHAWRRVEFQDGGRFSFPDPCG